MVAKERYDVVIIGGGVSGLFLSRLVAEKGYAVAVVEMKPMNEIGEKVCGDAVSRRYFAKLGLKEPAGNEVENVVKEVRIYSPSEKAILTVKGEGFELNRKTFGQRLLKESLESGAIVLDNSYLKKATIRDNVVTEVTIHDRNRGKDVILESRVFVDASGISGALRTKLPSHWWISEKINASETAVAYREIRVLSEDIENYDVLRIYLSQKITPGGYWWFFPRGPREVNIGLGVQWREGAPNPKEKFYAYLASMKEIEGSKVIHAGGGLVPTRRPLSAPVASGFLAIGDAALTCNPLHGGGIGPAMLSAKLAAESVSKALSEGNTDIRALWTYPIDYFKYYGYKQAALDIFRAFLQSLSKEEIEFGMAKKLVKEEEVYRVGMKGDLELSLAERALRALKALPKPSFLLRLSRVAKYMKLIKELYLNYPSSPDHFEKWLIEVRNLLSEYYRSLNIRKA